MTDNTAPNESFKMAGSVTSTKRVYMRAKEMEEFEKELETSRLAAENPDNTPASEQPVVPENPVSSEPKGEDPYEKRYKDLQSYTTKEINKLKATLAEKDSKLTEALASAAPQLPTSEEEFQQWVKDFPPLYNIMRTAIIKEINNGTEFADIKKQMKEVEDFRQTLANERGKNELLKLHPDADDFNEGGSKNAEFAAWYDSQEPEIQALVDSGIPSKIGRAISIFKDEKKIVTKTVSDKKKEAAKAVNVGHTPVEMPVQGKQWSESMVNRLTQKEYEKHYSEIEKSRANGNFIYDISRANN